MEKKEQVMSIMKDLENRVITRDRATELILILFNVSDLLPNKEVKSKNKIEWFNGIERCWESY